MEVLSYELYKDGGTEEIVTDKGTYCYDHRITSLTKGSLYLGYPKDDNSNIIEKPEVIEKELFEALRVYMPKAGFYEGHIERLLLIKDRK
jgi:hypothetical protein